MLIAIKKAIRVTELEVIGVIEEAMNVLTKRISEILLGSINKKELNTFVILLKLKEFVPNKEKKLKVIE